MGKCQIMRFCIHNNFKLYAHLLHQDLVLNNGVCQRTTQIMTNTLQYLTKFLIVNERALKHPNNVIFDNFCDKKKKIVMELSERGTKLLNKVMRKISKVDMEFNRWGYKINSYRGLL